MYINIHLSILKFSKFLLRFLSASETEPEVARTEVISPNHEDDCIRAICCRGRS